MALVYGQDERVTRWLGQQIDYPDHAPAMMTIGYERAGALVAAVAFDGVSATNAFVHVASDGRKLPVELLEATARYVFLQCRARRMTFMVNDDNERCLGLVRSLGAELEARLRGAHANGDVLIFALWDTSRFYRKLIATGRVVTDMEAYL